MNHKDTGAMRGFALVLAAFFVLAFLLTFRILPLPSLVIGDNFYWTPQNIQDIIGFRVVRESYLGDLAIVSTFKCGFLFPVAYLFSIIGLPSTLIYPFMFYLMSLLSFYFLSKEFLSNKGLRIIISAMYVINPVTPYYYASLINAFSLIFLPLGFKFFVRSLREIKQSAKPDVTKNFALTGLFLSLSVSANEQFFLSFALIALLSILTFLFVCFKKHGRTRKFVRISLFNITLFGLVFMLVNLPLFLSLANVQNAPMATYFRGRPLSDFLKTVQYTYRNADLVTLLRLGGDAGVGLGKNAWYDFNSDTNLFGYVLFAIFLVSIMLLIFRKDKSPTDRAFFYQSIVLFVTALALIMVMKNLPNNPDILGTPLDFVVQTWESPVKLRVVLLLAVLATSFVVFQKLETLKRKFKNKVFLAGTLTFLILSTIVYNSPWLIAYAGRTPIQQVADDLEWGDLFDQKYSYLSNLLQEKYPDERGLIVPYTHKGELYASPNFRLFQLVSDAEEQTTKMVGAGFVPWSKILGFLSVKALALKNTQASSETLIFPKLFDNNVTRALEEIRNDDGFKLVEKMEDFTIFENQNTLPLIYATRYYVFYDDISTLEYAFQLINFTDLPVFLSEGGLTNEFFVPTFVEPDKYQLNAIAMPNDSEDSNLTLIVSNAENSRNIDLQKITKLGNLDVFSTVDLLSSGDIVKVPESATRSHSEHIDEKTLNSTSFQIGTYESFTLNFTVNILENGGFSYLGPRVLIDADGIRYFLIIHDNGYLELAVQKNEIFTPSIIVQYTGHKLDKPSSFINVSVIRTFDLVQIYVDGDQAMSFSIEPEVANVSLSSEQSISKFSNIDITTERIFRLFATRQISENPTFLVQKNEPEGSALIVSNGGFDFVVVSQYLYTQLKNVETQVGVIEVAANVFFKGWVFNSTNRNLEEKLITVGIESWPLTTGLTIFSIVSTYFMLICAFTPLGKRFSSASSDRIKRLVHKKTQSEKEMHDSQRS